MLTTGFTKSHPCTEARHMMYRSLKSVKWLQRYCSFSIFSRWQPSAILDLWNVYLDHLRRVLGGLYCCAKFDWNRLGSFDNMQVFLFCHFGLKMFIYAMDFFGEGWELDPLSTVITVLLKAYAMHWLINTFRCCLVITVFGFLSNRRRSTPTWVQTFWRWCGLLSNLL